MKSLKKFFPVLLILLLIGSSSVLAAGESVRYQGHVQDYGWMDFVADGVTAGTTGECKRVEAVKIELNGVPEGSHIEYSPHVQDIGWMNYVADGQTAGTTGQSKRVEAFKIHLTGPISETHDVYYRSHIADFGWLDWAKNDEVSGTSGYAKPMEAIQIVLVPKEAAAPGTTGTPSIEKGGSSLKNGAGVNYVSYVRNVGWQNPIMSGVSGTTGQALPIEGLKIGLANLDGGIQYTTHVSDIGWTAPVGNDQESGAIGAGKQVEAITIALNGNIANYYNIFYRTHVSDVGWMGWAKNGEPAGSSNGFKAVEAYEVMLVPKAEAGPTSDSPAYKEFKTQIVATPGLRTVQNFLFNAMLPVGRTLYVWGGGWNEPDNGAGPGAVHLGVYPNWEPFFNQHDASYDYNTTKYQILNGLDCSGYVGWTVYNTINTQNDQLGEVAYADEQAHWYAQKGYGNYTYGTTDFKPGDIVSLEDGGHVYIVIGKCADGSYVIAHASPPGVMLTGLTNGAGQDSQARQLARQYMQKYYPEYFNRYNSKMDRYNKDYLYHTGVFRWGDNFCGDPDGIRNKSAQEVLQILFNE